MSTENIKKILEKKGIQPSFHRLKILEFLINYRTHPDVDEIYKNLHPQIPTLSKTTIYNTLKVFSEKGLVKEVMIEENEVRYDYAEREHIHFKCKKCNRIYDIFHDCEIMKKKKIEGNLIEECHIYLKGICKICLEVERHRAKK